MELFIIFIENRVTFTKYLKAVIQRISVLWKQVEQSTCCPATKYLRSNAMNQVIQPDTTNKLCPKCQQIQKLTDFYKNKNRKDGFDCYCKNCQNKKSKLWQLDNPDKVNATSNRWNKKHRERRNQISKNWRSNNVEQYQQIKKNWNQKNPDKIKIHNQTFYQNHTETIKNRVKEWKHNNSAQTKKYGKEWRQNNREIVRQYFNQRMLDPIKRLLQNQRSRIRGILHHNHLKKNQRTLKYLGCTADELKKHLEQQFTEGMTWDNHQQFGWHVDHIQPLSKFDYTDPEQVKIAFWYTNLQPLWWYDNLKKRDN